MGSTRTREAGTPRAPVTNATAESSGRTMLYDIGLTNKSRLAVTHALSLAPTAKRALAAT